MFLDQRNLGTWKSAFSVSFTLNSIQRNMLLDFWNVSLFQFTSLDNNQGHINYINAAEFLC